MVVDGVGLERSHAASRSQNALGFARLLAVLLHVDNHLVQTLVGWRLTQFFTYIVAVEHAGDLA
ncbi:hypothetical protein PSJM300_03795 [Stutzerimonas stutzeri DSM 10701]|nr:hypothetical protein PSJM300_03795 [Stutzerimonas stutzeri DSM 10701]